MFTPEDSTKRCPLKRALSTDEEFTRHEQTRTDEECAAFYEECHPPKKASCSSTDPDPEIMRDAMLTTLWNRVELEANRQLGVHRVQPYGLGVGPGSCAIGGAGGAEVPKNDASRVIDLTREMADGESTISFEVTERAGGEQDTFPIEFPDTLLRDKIEANETADKAVLEAVNHIFDFEEPDDEEAPQTKVVQELRVLNRMIHAQNRLLSFFVIRELTKYHFDK